MKKALLKNRVITIALFSAIAAACLFLGFGLNPAKASKVTIIGTPASVADSNGSFEVEAVDISDGIETKPAKHRVIYPSGEISEADVIKTNEYGVYRVVYYADFNGIEKSYIHNVTVNMPVFEMSKDSDEFAYTNNKLMGETKGAQIKLSSGGTATFSEVIDFNKLSSEEPLAEFFVLPKKAGFGIRGSEEYPYTQGSEDFREMVLLLTDVYDESNYIKMRIIKSDGFFCYLMTASRENQLSGLLNGEGTRLMTNGRFGTGMRLSLSNVHYSHDVTGQSFAKCWNRLYFDYAEKKLYYENSYAKYLVLDYDDSQYVSELWEGFSDGKAKLTITCSQFTGGNPATIMFTKLNGKDVTGSTVKDEISPDLLIDYQGYEKMPDALVGSRYPLFGYDTRDSNSLGTNSSVKVYKDFYGNKTEVDVRDNSFIPDSEGKYYAEYRVWDRFLNTVEKVLEINAFNNLSAVYMGIGEVGSFTVKQGCFVRLPEFTAGGGSGKCKSESYVIREGSDEVIYPENGGFIAYELGNYIVQYKATDYLGQIAVESFTVFVTTNDAPVIIDEVVLPQYFIIGKKYSLPVLTADYYDNTRHEIKTSIVVNENGVERKLDGNEYVVSNDVSLDNVEITYVAEVNGQKATKSYVVKTVNVSDGSELKTEKYFDVVNGEAVSDDDCVSLTFSKDGKARYINALLTDSFNIRFHVNGVPKFTRLNFVLTDAFDSSKSVVYSYFVDNAGVTRFSVNNGEQYVLSNSIGNGNVMNLTLNDLSGMAYPDGSTFVTFKSFEDGTVYKGFTDRCAYLTVEVENSQAGASVGISKINKQVLNGKVTVDRLGPSVSTVGDRKPIVQPGEDVVIRRAVAYDVLDSFTSVTVSVYYNKTENGKTYKEYITAANGVLLNEASATEDFFIKNLPSNRYYYEYHAKDSVTKATVTLMYSFEVVDIENPVITLSSGLKDYLRVGESVKFPSVKVTDNKDGEISEFKIYVKDSSGKYERVSESYTFKNAGFYDVVYIAFDASGNMGTLTYTIKVE